MSLDGETNLKPKAPLIPAFAIVIIPFTHSSAQSLHSSDAPAHVAALHHWKIVCELPNQTLDRFAGYLHVHGSHFALFLNIKAPIDACLRRGDPDGGWAKEYPAPWLCVAQY